MRSRYLVSAVLVALILVGLFLIVAKCTPTTTSDIVHRAEGMPGVIRIEAAEAEGDDAIPGEIIPKEVKILMKADSSADQIQRVLDRYDDDIDGGEVDLIDLFLKGGKRAHLSIGEGVHASRALVTELADVMQDQTIVAYHREAYPVLPNVGVELTPSEFSDVLTAADRFGEHGSVTSVTVKSGDFYLVRDDEDNHQKMLARERFTLATAQRFNLNGALVEDFGPLKLYVRTKDLDSARRWVDRTAPAEAGRVAVLTGSFPSAIG